MRICFVGIAIFLSFMSSLVSAQDGLDCRIEGYSYKLMCGEILVNRANKQQSPYKFTWYKVPSRAKYPKPSPIVWLPEEGVHPNERAPAIISMLSRLRNHHDVVWLVPSDLQENLDKCRDNTLPSLASKIYRYSDRAFLSACHQQILNAGLSAYDIKQQVSIYEQFRASLSVDSVIVLAEGRASHLALAWQQQAPDALALMVLDSPVATYSNRYSHQLRRAQAFERSIHKSLSMCMGDAECKRRYSNAEQDLQKIIDQLPINTTVRDPQTSHLTSLEVTDTVFHSMLNNVIRSPQKSALLPILLSNAASGNWQPMIGVQSLNWSKRISKFNHGLSLNQQCANFSLHYNQDSDIQQPVSHFVKWYINTEAKKIRLQCEPLAKNIAQTDAHLNLSYANVPVLALTGELDPFAEPPKNLGKRVHHIEVGNAGAGILGYPCTKDVVYRFVKSQLYAPSEQSISTMSDDACLSRIPYPAVTATLLDGDNND